MKREESVYKKKWMDTSCLYPLVTIESIDPERIKQATVAMKSDPINTKVKVTEYGGFYFILEGTEMVLAANILHKKNIEVEFVERTDLSFWSQEENMKEQLACIGMNAVYDFEALGGFRYAEYPDFYKGGN